MSGLNVIDQFKEACVKPNATALITGLQLSNPCAIDLSLEENYALKLALSRNFAYELVAYLIRDKRVLNFEHEHDYPSLRLAIEKKSLFVADIVSALKANHELPAEIEILIDAYNAANVRSSDQPKGSDLSFSQFANGVSFIEDYASAHGEIKKRGWNRFLCC